jgi:hypothetical protein
MYETAFLKHRMPVPVQQNVVVSKSCKVGHHEDTAYHTDGTGLHFVFNSRCFSSSSNRRVLTGAQGNQFAALYLVQ